MLFGLYLFGRNGNPLEYCTTRLKGASIPPGCGNFQNICYIHSYVPVRESGAEHAQMAEWSIAIDCKSIAQWATQVRILLCAPVRCKASRVRSLTQNHLSAAFYVSNTKPCHKTDLSKSYTRLLARLSTLERTRRA